MSTRPALDRVQRALYNAAMEEHIHDECGVIGVWGKDAARKAYYALVSLQHRGQESCGICVSNGEKLRPLKGMGLVQEVFHKENLAQLTGHLASAHVRYSTAGESTIENAQPFVSAYSRGQLAVSHNGQLVNYASLRNMLQNDGCTFSSTSDTEVILKLLARHHSVPTESTLAESTRRVMAEIRGSYGLVIMTHDALIGARDPCGIRPLVLGSFEDGGYALASESCALDAMGATLMRDVEAGEIVVIDEDGIKSYPMQNNALPLSPCIFEYVYFARPDSVSCGISVEQGRINMGRALAREDMERGLSWTEHGGVETVVVGVPDSGLAAAEGYAQTSGVPYGTGIIKNKYIGRSFIAPTQTEREEAVRVKLNPVRSIVSGKRVIVIDDSIVRGTTSRRLVQLLRRAGAVEVHFRVSSPEVLYPCYFGIDTPSRKELVSAQMTDEEVCREIGADSLRFLSLQGMLDSLRRAMDDAHKGQECAFCRGCFTGKYPIDVEDKE